MFSPLVSYVKLNWAAILRRMHVAFHVPTDGSGRGWGAWVVVGTGAGVVVVTGAAVDVVFWVVVVVSGVGGLLVVVVVVVVCFVVVVEVVVVVSGGGCSSPILASFNDNKLWESTGR